MYVAEMKVLKSYLAVCSASWWWRTCPSHIGCVRGQSPQRAWTRVLGFPQWSGSQGSGGSVAGPHRSAPRTTSNQYGHSRWSGSLIHGFAVRNGCMFSGGIRPWHSWSSGGQRYLAEFNKNCSCSVPLVTTYQVLFKIFLGVSHH